LTGAGKNTLMIKFLEKVFSNPRFILAIYALLAVGIAMQEYHLGSKSDTSTHFNNYIIFRQSFFHLVHHQNLYASYSAEHFDYYKYSPAFAVFMGIFAFLPIAIGLIFWDLLNALILFFAIKALPVNDKKIRIAVWWFVVIELITSLQNSQSNALLAGLLLLAFCFLERRKIAWGTLMIVLTVFIKIFGLVALSLFLLYPDKKRFVLYTALWMGLLALIPLLVISPSQLISLYENWWKLLSTDYSGSAGISVMGWLNSWFHIAPPKNMVTFTGIIIFCIPLIFTRRYDQFIFRWLFFCSILIWVIIFNHKAESATFIIAVCGIALWYFAQERNYFNLALLILAFVFTCLSPTDLFPPAVRVNFFVPYTVKVVPCIVIWVKLIYELITASYKPKIVLQ
jgi:hypothetical protein